MSANKVLSVPDLTFVSMTGPALDAITAKSVRAHTTRINFARRRRRLVQEYATRKQDVARSEPFQAIIGSQATNCHRQVEVHLPIFNYSGVDRNLSDKDAFFINHLAQAMGKLHLVANIPGSRLPTMQSDWARFLSDPTMLDVSLYFARHVYAARLQHRAAQLVVDTYKGRAIRSLREHLNGQPHSLSDGLIGAIFLLTVLDQASGNIEAWTIHVSGLLQILEIRSRNSASPPEHWTLHTIPRLVGSWQADKIQKKLMVPLSTTLQGLVLFTRHDGALLPTIEKTGIFNTMFSAPAKKAAYLLLANAEQVAALIETYIRSDELCISEQFRVRRVIKSLEKAIHLNRTAFTREAFLTAKAVSIKIFLQILLRCTTNRVQNLETTAVQLMAVLQEVDEEQQQPPSSLALCSSLESVFWQTMMGALAASDVSTKSFYASRLGRLSVPLALTSWQDALMVLQKFFWIPSIFSGPCYEILSKVLQSQGDTNLQS